MTTATGENQREVISHWLSQRGHNGSSSQFTGSTTSLASILSDMKTGYSEEDLSATASSTSASLHLTHGVKEGKHCPLSARVHIEVPNPSVEQVDDTLTTPNHVCCVIDVSASMTCGVRVKDEAGKAENTGLTTLDIVKFSTLVIALSLNAQDKLSIVTYGDDAVISLRPIHMTLDGKAKVKSTLDKILLQRRTNLCAGVTLGISQANDVGPDYINSVFVLTDGQPTLNPILGYKPTIDAALLESPVFGTVSTFGFGNNLDSKLLTDIATMGGGTYSYLPDAGMVGTCFINALANSRCAYGVGPRLKITGCDIEYLAKSKLISSSVAKRNCDPGRRTIGQKLGIKKHRRKEKEGGEEVVGGLTVDGRLTCTLQEDVIYVHLTPLRYGSNVDVVLHPRIFDRDASGIKIELCFATAGDHAVRIPCVAEDPVPSEELFHTTRAEFARAAYAVAAGSYSPDGVEKFVDAAAAHGADGNMDLEALYEDMKGQATEAIQNKADYVNWGKHFLFSLSTAHLHQFCNNFKDPGVQTYGNGTLFSFLQDLLDDIFECIPPPVGRVTKNDMVGNMKMGQVFNNRNAVCVHGETKVTVRRKNGGGGAEGSVVEIRSVQKGDEVLVSNGDYVTVDCLVETTTSGVDPFRLVKVGDLRVTPYHPVKPRRPGGWRFPIDVADDASTAAVRSVYNLVLEPTRRHEPVLMDGVESITLGHGIEHDPVLRHGYFGTDAVVDDLRRFGGGVGWKGGHVVVTEDDVARDGVTGLVRGIEDDGGWGWRSGVVREGGVEGAVGGAFGGCGPRMDVVVV